MAAKLTISEFTKMIAENYNDIDIKSLSKEEEFKTPVKTLLDLLKKQKKADTSGDESEGSKTKVKLTPEEQIAKLRETIAELTKKKEANKFRSDKTRTENDEKLKKAEDKLAKLESPEEKPAEEEKPKKVRAKKEAAEKPEEKEKRIKRMSPTMAKQLEAALSAANIGYDDKLKKEFVKYIDDLTDDDFRKDGLADHMRAFAKLKSDAEKPEDKPAEPNAADIAGVGGGAGSPANQEAVKVTLKELQDKNVATVAADKYWDPEEGRMITGPAHDDDEDFSEVKFEGVDLVVGDKTGRVYEAREEGDFFCGFVGVGKFKSLKVNA